MKIWKGYTDVDKTVATIATVFRQTGTVPRHLHQSVAEHLDAVTRGYQMRFYETMSEQCPEALTHFTDEALAALHNRTQRAVA